MHVLEFLLKKGFDTETSDNHDRVALHHAAMISNFEGCELLLKRGANIAKKSNITDETPLIAAIK